MNDNMKRMNNVMKVFTIFENISDDIIGYNQRKITFGGDTLNSVPVFYLTEMTKK